MHRLYENGDISVFWNSDKCRHAKKCVTGCPEAFNINRKPWIKLDEADTSKVWKAVSNCPSGALTCVYNHDIRVVFDKDNNRSVAYDGEALIGECDYQMTDEGLDIYHTEVNPEYGGKGIAKRLVYVILQEAEYQKVKVIPTCSYAVKVLNND